MQRGRDVTFEEFVAEHGAGLLRFARALTGDHHLAEDLCQATLADAFRHWRRVAAADAPEAYVRRMLVNTHLSWRRRRWWGERPAGLATTSTGPANPAGAPEARLESLAAVRSLLGHLPRRARTVLALRYYADLDDATIARWTGMSESSVRSTAARALARLRSEAQAQTVEGRR